MSTPKCGVQQQRRAGFQFRVQHQSEVGLLWQQEAWKWVCCVLMGQGTNKPPLWLQLWVQQLDSLESLYDYHTHPLQGWGEEGSPDEVWPWPEGLSCRCLTVLRVPHETLAVLYSSIGRQRTVSLQLMLKQHQNGGSLWGKIAHSSEHLALENGKYTVLQSRPTEFVLSLSFLGTKRRAVCSTQEPLAPSACGRV